MKYLFIIFVWSVVAVVALAPKIKEMPKPDFAMSLLNHYNSSDSGASYAKEQCFTEDDIRSAKREGGRQAIDNISRVMVSEGRLKMESNGKTYDIVVTERTF